MRTQNTLFVIAFIVLNFVGELWLPGNTAADSSKTSGPVVAKEILQTGVVSQKDRLNLISVFAFTVGEEAIGGVALYDDPTTDRPADYLELYDQGGDLLAVGWFDRFGIERTAVDRGLLENADKPEGVFVVLLDGDFI